MDKYIVREEKEKNRLGMISMKFQKFHSIIRLEVSSISLKLGSI